MIPRCFQIHMSIAGFFRRTAEGLIILIEEIRGTAQLDKPWTLGIARLTADQRNRILFFGRQTRGPVQSPQLLRQQIGPLPIHHLPRNPGIVQSPRQGGDSGKPFRTAQANLHSAVATHALTGNEGVFPAAAVQPIIKVRGESRYEQRCPRDPCCGPQPRCRP